MVINYYGKQFFKVSLGDFVIAIDPISKDSKSKATRFGANIAISSLNHPDMNGLDQVSYGGKEPFLIYGPGEYEVQGIFIKGYPAKSSYGGKDIPNTVYTIKLEDMNLVFLGATSEKDLPGELMEELDEVDILFTPIGGEGTLTPAESSKLATKLEAKVVIPMNYNQDMLKTFLKEEGEEGLKSEEKLVIKKKDISTESGKIVVLKSED